METIATHEDVTTVMRLIADIQRDVERIRKAIEDDDGEEEADDPEADG